MLKGSHQKSQPSAGTREGLKQGLFEWLKLITNWNFSFCLELSFFDNFWGLIWKVKPPQSLKLKIVWMFFGIGEGWHDVNFENNNLVRAKSK